jgi:type I restriction-modification system DNA methylase subunit
LGTHSTPAYIADYLVWHLLPWIEEIPLNDREVFEPACGHAVFLVSAMRAMRELLPATHLEPAQRHRYFKGKLHGVDVDAFALEIARLSLTLADIPNPNGWDPQVQDVFLEQELQERASRCMVLLANPPFENFTKSERSRYSGLLHKNKTAELLARALVSRPRV